MFGELYWNLAPLITLSSYGLYREVSVCASCTIAPMRPDKALRVAGLVLLTATALKVFLVDASALAGALRILSFLGLGVALIGIGKLYTAVLNAEAGNPIEAGGGAD